MPTMNFRRNIGLVLVSCALSVGVTPHSTATDAGLGLKNSTAPVSKTGLKMDPNLIANKQIKNFDLNGDAKLSVDEFLAPGVKLFKQQDRNKDGYLSKQEISEFTAGIIKQMATNKKKGVQSIVVE